jgi:hypothetical protein
MRRVRGARALARLFLMCCLALPSSFVTSPLPGRVSGAAAQAPPPSRRGPLWLSALRGGGASSARPKRERGNAERGARPRSDSERDESSRAAPRGVRKAKRARQGAGDADSGAGAQSLALKGQERRLSTMSAEAALRGSLADRLQWLVGKEAGTVQGSGGQKVSAAQAAMVSHVRSLQTVLQTQDQAAISAVLDEVAATARKTYAPDIWSVGELKTGGFALGGSGRQKMLQRSTTAYAKTEVVFDGSGASVAEIRSKAHALCLPNPTDEVCCLLPHSSQLLAAPAPLPSCFWLLPDWPPLLLTASLLSGTRHR